MTRKTLDLGLDVDYVQVLDADGALDEDLEPDVPDDDLRKLYRTMLLVREFDENRLRLQRQGEIGTFAPCKGQEAAQLGSVYTLRKEDWFVPSFRETAAAFWRGMKPEDDLLYAAGFEEGIAIADDAHDLPIAIPVASQIPHAVGLAWAAKIQDKDQIAMGYVGDGGTSEGDFHEGMNMAAVYQAPVVVVCQNNQWAISVPRAKQTRSETIAQKGWAYDIPSVQVDGNDILAMIKVCREAAERAKDGDGPTFIEAITYRMGVHTTADDPSKYRDDQEVETWRARDPIDRFRTYLMDKSLLDDDEDTVWHEEVKKEVKDAVERFRDKVPTDLDPVWEHQWGELPSYTKRQKEAFEARWARYEEIPEAH